ncbi:phage regulatory CII family protein [Thauera aromatica]|uniref:phage regulatory CII family protein n=1 Tax=Thauera aromatica TaxID=59405 RepID=UPI001FFCDD12|nr:phage regulatory CII family protein [Thauera aromatica]MCK2095207.1 hypothetical protein [Thauera aromatica]
MTQEDDLSGALSHSEKLKIDFAPVVRALYQDMTAFCTPGIQSGVAEVAELIGRSENSLRHQFGPTCYDHAPSVHLFLSVIEATAARHAVHEIARLAGCMAVPNPPSATSMRAPDRNDEAFLRLIAVAQCGIGPLLKRLGSDRPLSAAERAKARAALDDVIAYAAHLRGRVS